MRKALLIIGIAISLISGCCKDKDNCKNGQITIQPFTQRFAKFECNNNDEYTYVFRSKKQIDSLEPNCYIINSIGFPVDEKDMAYIIIGRSFEHYGDTFQTVLRKDTCLKKFIYEVEGIQRDTTKYCCPYGIKAVSSMFCSVENIPADYTVEVKYKYVPIQ